MTKFYTYIIAVLLSIGTAGSEAFAQGEGGKSTGAQGLGMFLPLILIFVIFYFLVVRPQQKQAKQRQAMISAVEKGDEIIMVDGIHGRVVGIADQILTVEIADNCKVKMDRSGVQSVKNKQAS